MLSEMADYVQDHNTAVLTLDKAKRTLLLLVMMKAHCIKSLSAFTCHWRMYCFHVVLLLGSQ